MYKKNITSFTENVENIIVSKKMILDSVNIYCLCKLKMSKLILVFRFSWVMVFEQILKIYFLD